LTAALGRDHDVSEGDAIASEQNSWPGRLSILLVAIVVLVAIVAALVSRLAPGSEDTNFEIRTAAAAIIFVGSYLALAIGRIPGLHIDRAGIALVGAGLMVASGALTLDQAYQAIDGNTITLLLGMMIVVACLRLSGFFAMASEWAIERTKGPVFLLCAIVATAGIFSAFLVNDSICLVMAPLVLELTLALGRPPVPYLLAVAMASNVGSSATITGNPQNIMIGSFSRISYTDFVVALGPVALVGLIVTVALIALLHREEFSGGKHFKPPKISVRIDRGLMVWSVAATLALIVLFFFGTTPAKAAIIVGGLLLLKSRGVFEEIDWSLLLMFCGLFIIVAGAERTLFTPETLAAVSQLRFDEIPVLAGVTAVLSNLVSNVPAVLILKPFIASLKDQETAWLTIAMAATFAGNFTILGSIANLIVVQRAAASGVQIGFWDHFRVGAPLTIITLAIGTWWLML
jgi:Na+/H+ antiporter NhaD/arsenite permease-like protein